MKNLVLLTNGYPFGSGETFIETEINELSKNFDTITLVSVSNNYQNKRALPKNCRILSFQSIITLKRIPMLTWVLLTHLKLFITLVNSELKNIKLLFKLKPNSTILAKLLIDLIKAFDIYRFLHKQRFESTIFYSYWFDQKALALVILKQNSNAVCISRAHRADLYFEHSPIKYLSFQKIKLDLLDKVFPISSHGKEYLCEKLHCSNSKISVSRLGVIIPENTLTFKPNVVKTLVSCSILSPVKRVDLIIKVLARLNSLSIQWIHLGGGSLLNDLQTMAIKELSSTNHRFQFMGMLTNAEIYKFYSQTSIDAFLNVSESEGIPVSIMEAMAFGIPVIATHVGGTSELVDPTNGVLLPKEFSVDFLVNQLETFFALDEPTIKDLRINAQQKVRNQYDAIANFTQFIKEIKAL